MTAGREIDRLRGLGFDVSTDGADLILTPACPGAVLTPERRKWLVDHKAELVAFLRSLPAFTHAEEVELVNYYVSRPRAERLAMHNAGRAYHAAGWPWREADLRAMSEHRRPRRARE